MVDKIKREKYNLPIGLTPRWEKIMSEKESKEKQASSLPDAATQARIVREAVYASSANPECQKLTIAERLAARK